jgi:hypothetical protein
MICQKAMFTHLKDLQSSNCFTTGSFNQVTLDTVIMHIIFLIINLARPFSFTDDIIMQNIAPTIILSCATSIQGKTGA